MSLQDFRTEFVPGTTVAQAVTTTDATATVVAKKRYRVVSTVDCYINDGSSAGTAGTPAETAMFVPAKTPEVFAFANTSVHAMIATGGTAGTVYFTRLSEADV